MTTLATAAKTKANDGLPAHFRLAPSSMYRILPCPASAVEGLPEDTRPESEAGTIGHEAGKEWLDSQQFYPLLLLEAFVYDAVVPLLGKAKADDIAQATAYYCEYVASLPGERHTETKIKHATIPDFGGTLDATLVTSDMLHVPDLKTGYWKVPIKDNPQIQSYLVLARQEYGRRDIYRGTIVQPRTGEPKTATWTNPELDAFELLVSIAGRSKRVNAGDWCRFCPLRQLNCVKGQQYGLVAGW